MYPTCTIYVGRNDFYFFGKSEILIVLLCFFEFWIWKIGKHPTYSKGLIDGKLKKAAPGLSSNVYPLVPNQVPIVSRCRIKLGA